MHPTPRSRMSRTRVRVSSAVPRRVSGSQNSTFGQRPVAARARWSAARSTPAAMPMVSVDMDTLSTPRAPAASSRRSTMATFSALGNTEARATRRRMSRPDIGLATMPRAEPGTTVST